MPDLDDLRAEAERLELPLDDDDLRAILQALRKTRAELATLPDGDALEPPYRFTPAGAGEGDEG